MKGITKAPLPGRSPLGGIALAISTAEKGAEISFVGTAEALGMKVLLSSVGWAMMVEVRVWVIVTRMVDVPFMVWLLLWW